MTISNQERLLFLINPRSGGSRAVQTISMLRQYAETTDPNVQVVELGRDLPVAALISSSGAEIVVVGGGDGTFSTLLPQFAVTTRSIGLLPLGTGNDLARELGLSSLLRVRDVADLVTFYREAASREVTYFNLEFGDGYSSKTGFINYVSFGYDAKVVADFAQLREHAWWRSLRGVWGNRLGYTATALRNILHDIASHSPFDITNADGSSVIRGARSLVFANIRSMMGLASSNPHSSIFDAKIECVVVGSIVQYLSMLCHHRIPIFHPRFVGSSDWWEVRGLPPGVHIQIDGEHRPDISSDRFRISKAGTFSMLVGRLR